MIGLNLVSYLKLCELVGRLNTSLGKVESIPPRTICIIGENANLFNCLRYFIGKLCVFDLV